MNSFDNLNADMELNRNIKTILNKTGKTKYGPIEIRNKSKISNETKKIYKFKFIRKSIFFSRKIFFCN